MKLNINGVTVEVSDTDLTAAIEAKKESIDIKSDDLVIRTSEKHEDLINNTKKSSQVIGEEIGRKEVFKSLEIDVEGTGAYKTADKAAAALKTWSGEAVTAGVTAAGIDPDKKLEAANKDVETLRESLKASQLSLTTEQDGRKTDRKNQIIATKILDSLPDNIALPGKAIRTLLMSETRFDADENGNVFQLGADGEPLKDGEANVLPLDTTITSFLDANPTYRTGAAGGAGGGDSSRGDKLKTFSEFSTEMSEAGHTLNGEEFRAEMEKQQAAGVLEK